MRYRDLGDTGLKVSEIGMGCEGFAEDEGRMCARLFDVAEASGVDLFDLYAADPAVRGAVGRALEGRREKFKIQAHICSAWKDGQYERTRDMSEVRASFEELMRLLRTDHIDVGMIHYCDALSDWETIVEGGVLEYVRSLKAEGRIDHIGLSSHNPLVALEAVESGAIEVLMFSVNPCYDLMPADEDVEQLWNEERYAAPLVDMDPDRRRLYETCQRRGVGITVMKCFGGGDLLDAELSPAGAALTAHQCIHYALDRPGVASVMAGAKTTEQIEVCVAYESASDEERDYASAFASFPRISWKGHCMYCGHCAPCPAGIDIASVTKFLNLARAQGAVPETVRGHHELLARHGGDCLQCGACEARCPFDVPIKANMREAASIFGM
ncbi:MAG: aldo/keto reductase [Synergistaceae bacterium]|nr:aldo/keto reductase [Synergistaceae bacterium]